MNQTQSREEIEALTDEEQDAHAQIVLDDLRRREEIKSKASGYPGSGIYRGGLGVTVILAIAGLAFMIWNPSLEGMTILGLIAALGAMQWHVRGLNNRLDAVMELVEELQTSTKELERRTE